MTPAQGNLSGRAPLLGRDDHEYSGGAYGRDGAPASKFMLSVPAAHRPPGPHRPNIAPSERPLPPAARFHPAPYYGSPSPPAYDGRVSTTLPVDVKLSPPKAAFLEPSSPTTRSFAPESSIGLVHGEAEKSQVLPDDDHLPPVWKDLQRGKTESRSNWLAKQSQAGSKFKIITWIIAVTVLLLIGASLERLMTKKAHLANPAPLGWANGVADQPTFGVNSSSTNGSKQLDSTTKPSTHARRSLKALRSRRAH